MKKIERAFRSGNRESAYVHAITAAGLVSMVTRACSSGTLADCGCDNTVTQSPPASANLAALALKRSMGGNADKNVKNFN